MLSKLTVRDPLERRPGSDPFSLALPDSGR